MGRGPVLMSDTITYSMEDFDEDITTILNRIHHVPSPLRAFDLVIGVNRGGLVPGACISHALDLKLLSLNFCSRSNFDPEAVVWYFEHAVDKGYTHCLLVDDLTDSGQTVEMLLNSAWQAKPHPPTISLCTLLHNTDLGDLGVDHYYGTGYSRKKEPRYFDFWWEMYK